MTSKERIYAILNGGSFDRPAVTPIFMAWAANFIGHIEICFATLGEDAGIIGAAALAKENAKLE